jgi:NAD-dependent dihydropyrimidine dehydrogenase PreA subunit
VSRPLWFVRIIQHFFTERFQIASWTKKSRLIKAVVDFFLFHGDEIYYLPKDEVIENVLKRKSEDADGYLTARFSEDDGIVPEPRWSGEGNTDVAIQEDVLVQVQQDIEQPPSITMPSTVIRQFIQEANYIFLMEKCLCRDNMQCKDYPIELGCIFMGEAVKGINPKLGHMATKEEAIKRIDLAAEHGLIHLVGKNKIDTQWMGVHPGGRLLTVCNCCPCCCLYKVLPDLHEDIASKVEKMPGIEVGVNADICVGCGKCTEPEVCMTHNLSVVDGKAVMGDNCVGCGRCYEVCPVGAIEIDIQNEDYINETIRRLKAKVDVK